VPPERVHELINASTGIEISFEEMLSAGERGWNLKRVINNRFGLNGEYDTLPKALTVAYEDDPSGFVPDFPAMLNAYYNIREWDEKTGIPKSDKLKELNLDWTIKDLKYI
jgi:aldehyde:ferredoxin oxidoreductase